MPLPSEKSTKPIEYPCAVCGAASSGCVWDTDLCHEHYGAWYADERFASGSVDAAIGMKKVKGQVLEFYPPHTPAQAKASEVEYRKRTAAWLGEMRTKARAA